MRKAFWCGLGILLYWLVGPVESALTHGGGPLQPHDLWSVWSQDPLIWLGLGLIGILYTKGIKSLWHQAGIHRGVTARQAFTLSAGLIVLFIALISPLDALGETLFSAHMSQHVLLTSVAAPLIVIGAPPVALAWSVPGIWRARLARWWHRRNLLRSFWRVISIPFVVRKLHAAALWIWHIPPLYQAAVRNNGIHILQHVSFLGTALLFWWAVVRHEGNGLGVGLAVMFVFTTMLQTGLLGALMTFSEQPWYPADAENTLAWGLTPLEDQQLAGLIMWVPAGIVYVGVAIGILGNWLFRMDELDSRKRLSL